MDISQRAMVIVSMMIPWFMIHSAHATVYDVITGEAIPGTESIVPGPGILIEKRVLDRANLVGVDLHHGVFTEVRLEHAALDGASLRDSIIWDSSFKNASIVQADLTRVECAGCDFSGADLSGANLRDARFLYSDWSQTDLSGAVINGAQFLPDPFGGVRGSRLTNAQLYSTRSYQQKDLRRATILNDSEGLQLQGYDLRDADLTDANTLGIQIADARIEGIQFGAGDLQEIKNSIRSTQTFRQKSLRGVSWKGAQIGDFDLRGFDLRESNLSVFGMDLTNALVEGARLEFLTPEQLYSTESYRQRNLRGMALDTVSYNFDLTGQDITGATFDAYWTTSIKDAMITEATILNLYDTRLQETKSYQERDLRGILFVQFAMPGGDLSGQDLRNSVFAGQISLRAADMRGADLRNTRFYNSPSDTCDQGCDLTRFDLVEFDASTVYNQWTVFPTLENGAAFNPLQFGLTYRPSPLGDFDADDVVDQGDLDRLIAYRDGPYADLTQRDNLVYDNRLPMYDLNGDQRVTQTDVEIWIRDVKRTGAGDSNLDGAFDSQDLLLAFQLGGYEDAEGWNSNWAGGDWDFDQEFTSKDLVLAMQRGTYENFTAATISVPETHHWGLLGLCALMALSHLRPATRRIAM